MRWPVPGHCRTANHPTVALTFRLGPHGSRMSLIAAAGRAAVIMLGSRGLKFAVRNNSLGSMAAVGVFAAIGGWRRHRGHPRDSQRGSHAMSSRSSARQTGFGAPDRRVTDVLFVINCAVFLAQFVSKDRLLLWGAKDNQLIRAGQWWRFITPVALHANLLHLVCNNHALNNLGPLMERLSGRQRFISVYTVSAVAGSVASFLFNSSPSVGASGAIFGLGGALAVFAARHKNKIPGCDSILESLSQSLVINIAIGAATPRVDQWGHMGGLLGGALTAYLLGPRLETVGYDAIGRTILEDRPPVPVFAGQ